MFFLSINQSSLSLMCRLEVDMLRNQQLTLRMAFAQLETKRANDESTTYETPLQTERTSTVRRK